MKEKILIVDDDANARTTLVDIFQESGYRRVKGAQDGVEALTTLKTFTPNLIILDVNMPNMGGIEFYDQVCDNDHIPKYPIFVITGRAEMENLFKQMDVVGFISKPFDVRKLLEEVDIVMEKRDISKIHEEGRKRVIIVNNDPDAIPKICAAFTDAEYDVESASTGTTALAKIMENPPDMALIELGLEDISGDMVAFKLRSMHKTKHVINVLYTYQAVEYRVGVYEKINRKSGVEAMLNFTDPQELVDKANQIFRKVRMGD